MIVNVQDISVKERQDLLLHAIAPRPIAFVSTIDKDGNANLSPFSFFNIFSTNPPIVIFSPSRSVRNNTTKHTLDNLKEVPEAAISIVTYDMVQQTSLASCEYPRDVDEFIKAGFTKEKATHIQPPLVKQSLVKLECKVIEIKALGNTGGSGNLVICEVLFMHIDDSILNNSGNGIDQAKLNHVARLGGDWYCRVNEHNLFAVARPNAKQGIGFDQLPAAILHSTVLSGNHLAQLANVEAIPDQEEAFNNMAMTFIIKQYRNNEEKMNRELHKLSAELLNNNMAADAWQVLLRTINNLNTFNGNFEIHNQINAPL